MRLPIIRAFKWKLVLFTVILISASPLAQGRKWCSSHSEAVKYIEQMELLSFPIAEGSHVGFVYSDDLGFDIEYIEYRGYKQHHLNMKDKNGNPIRNRKGEVEHAWTHLFILHGIREKGKVYKANTINKVAMSFILENPNEELVVAVWANLSPNEIGKDTPDGRFTIPFYIGKTFKGHFKFPEKTRGLYFYGFNFKSESEPKYCYSYTNETPGGTSCLPQPNNKRQQQNPATNGTNTGTNTGTNNRANTRTNTRTNIGTNTDANKDDGYYNRRTKRRSGTVPSRMEKGLYAVVKPTPIFTKPNKYSQAIKIWDGKGRVLLPYSLDYGRVVEVIGNENGYAKIRWEGYMNYIERYGRKEEVNTGYIPADCITIPDPLPDEWYYEEYVGPDGEEISFEIGDGRVTSTGCVVECDKEHNVIRIGYRFTICYLDGKPQVRTRDIQESK